MNEGEKKRSALDTIYNFQFIIYNTIVFDIYTRKHIN